MGPPPQQDLRAAKRALATRRMIVGAILCIVGIAITAGTYSSAQDSGGGVYFIAYGPIVVGGIRFLQGVGGLIVWAGPARAAIAVGAKTAYFVRLRDERDVDAELRGWLRAALAAA